MSVSILPRLVATELPGRERYIANVHRIGMHEKAWLLQLIGRRRKA